MSEEAALEDVELETQLEEEVDTEVEAEVEVPEQDEVEDSQSEDIQEDNIDYEAYAKVQGWAPKEKWRGNPDDWVDAKSFVERGREFQSTLKEKNQRLEKKLEEQSKAMERFEKFTAKQLEKQKAEALNTFKKQQKEALEDGNDALYDELEEKKVKTLAEFEPEATKPEEPKQPTVPEETQRWMQENSWYGDDPILTDYAVKYCDKMASKGLSIGEQLEATKKYIVDMFPQRFQNQRRNIPTAVSKKVSTSTPKPQSKGVKWSDLSSSEQRLAEGQMKQFGWDKATFLKEYSEMENL